MSNDSSFEDAIGIFDSGVGGLTVLKSLTSAFPSENFLYVGDTARLPYGAKSGSTIRAYLEQAINYLISQKVKAIVVACNSASTQLHESEMKSIPIYNVIDPGVQAALDSTQNKKIGIIGTRATIESETYQNRILESGRKRFGAEAPLEVFSQACPLFVPLVEEGWTDDPVTNLIIYRYLSPLFANGVDTLILGCTHYPLLAGGIRRVAGNSVNLVDSGASLSRMINDDFANGRIARIAETPSSDKAAGGSSDKVAGKIFLRSTDLSQHFLSIAQGILGATRIHSNEKIDLRMES